jgi:hypothetical protein
MSADRNVLLHLEVRTHDKNSRKLSYFFIKGPLWEVATDVSRFRISDHKLRFSYCGLLVYDRPVCYQCFVWTYGLGVYSSDTVFLRNVFNHQTRLRGFINQKTITRIFNARKISRSCHSSGCYLSDTYRTNAARTPTPNPRAGVVTNKQTNKQTSTLSGTQHFDFPLHNSTRASKTRRLQTSSRK